MCSDTSKYILLLILFFECVIRMTTGLRYQICKEQSECILLKDCKPYMELIRTLEKPLTTTVTDFLRSRECGFQEGYPKVCCTSLPKNLPIWKRASSDSAPHKNKVGSSKISAGAKVHSSDKIAETSAKKPKYTPEELKKKSDAINKAFDLSELLDFTGSFDLFRRKRFNYNSSLDIEVR